MSSRGKNYRNWVSDMFMPDPVLSLIGLFFAVLFSFYSWYSVDAEADRQKRRIRREANFSRAAERARRHQERHFGGGERIIRVRTDDKKKEKEKEEEDVLVAVGYGFANAILLKGPDGVVLVGALETPDSIKRALGAFSSVLGGELPPVRALLLTHFSAHGCGGAEVLSAAGVPVVAHDKFENCQRRARDLSLRGGRRERATAAGGWALGEAEEAAAVGGGIGKDFRFPGGQASFPSVTPTKTFSDRLRLSVAGLELDLLHSPGDTADHFVIWWKERGTVLCGDNFYSSFPLVTPLDGSPCDRSCADRIRALEMMSSLRPRVLIPHHTLPLVSEGEAEEALAAHRDALKYVHDQTVRHMNKGLHPDEVVELVAPLPDRLASHPCLGEHYGAAEWAVRGVFEQGVGWFSGHPADLHGMEEEPRETSERFVRLAGGEEKCLEKARAAFNAFELQWALELCQHLRNVNPDNKDVTDLAILTLNLMATRETSSQGRNLYLTASKDLREQLEGKKKNRKDTYTREAVKEALDARELLRVLKVTVDPDRAEELVGGADEAVRVRLEAKRDKKGTVADVTEFKIRHGILDDGQWAFIESEASLVIKGSLDAIKKLFLGEQSVGSLTSKGEIQVEERRDKKIKKLLSIFDV